jgi:DNA repair exonuclease SbcCD nuclease subunit
MPTRILVLSDTHLGIDLPARPRSGRRPRGEDFFAAFEAALAPARGGETDLVVHCGDLFYRSRVPAWLAARVFARLGELADSGIDLFWVPGNHERSQVPRALLLSHPRVRVFDRPRTFVVERDGISIALAGFPFAPRLRHDFAALVTATGHRDAPADVRLLCLHQAVEGATVGTGGPRDFVFRDGDEVLRGRDLPAAFAAVVSGHVHRAQVLVRDLAGRRLAAPVLYPGSTERTSIAERDETKGTLMLEIARDPDGAPTVTWERRRHAVRPMVHLDLDPRAAGRPPEGDGRESAAGFADRLRELLAALDPRSVVRIRLTAEPPPAALPLLGAAALRALAPAEMDVTVSWRNPPPRARRTPPPRPPAPRQATLFPD